MPPDSARVRLRELTARPYWVPLPSRALPSTIIARLGDHQHSGALWGDWFGGGVLIFDEPWVLRRFSAAPDAFALVDELPRLEEFAADPPRLVGGGWLTCLGYAADTTTCAFYGSLLRWTPDEGWRFESLGLTDRADHDRAALARWSRLLSTEPPVSSVDIGPFRTRAEPDAVRDGHLAAVEGAISRIHRGDFYQANVCTRLQAESTSPAAMIFAELGERLRPAYGGLMSGPSADGRRHALVSFSPELFLGVADGTIRTAPIKGTAPRTADETDSPTLRASAKDAAENVMIVDLMRNDLSRVCRPGTVQVDGLLKVEAHAGVWHLVSTVTGELLPGTSASDILAATFPPGSVTGAPKIAAQRGIDQLETEPRGAYTGALGLVSPSAGTQLNVIIRSFEISGSQIQLGVGGGITADSVPIREWYECLHKAAPLVRAAGSRFAAGLTEEPDPPRSS